MVGHLGPDGRYLPLLPRGDPNKPRARARFSVVDMPKEDLHKIRGVKEAPSGRKSHNLIKVV